MIFVYFYKSFIEDRIFYKNYLNKAYEGFDKARRYGFAKC